MGDSTLPNTPPSLALPAARAGVWVLFVLAVVATIDRTGAGGLNADESWGVQVGAWGVCWSLAVLLVASITKRLPRAPILSLMMVVDAISIGLAIHGYWQVAWPLAGLLPLLIVDSVRTIGVRFALGHAPMDFVVLLFASPTAMWVEPAVVISLSMTVVIPLAMLRTSSNSHIQSNAAASETDAIGMVSHELRTPLHVIISSVRLLSMDRLDVADRELIDNVATSAASLKHLVDDLLDQAALKAGALSMASEDFRVEHLVERVREAAKAPAEARRQVIRWAVEPSIPLLNGPLRRCEQVLNNLVQNAIKYTPDGGDISVTITQPAATKDGLVQLCFLVSDRGPGIPDAQKGLIFHPFVQASSGIRRRAGGVGLGLTIARQISDLMAGELRIHDNPGGGSIFTWTVSVPVSTSKTTAEHVGLSATIAAHRARCRPKHCLVVDDSALNRRIAERVLVEAGHSSMAVAGGQAALEAMDRDHFDVVLLDLHMPGMSGWDVLAALRSQPGRAHPPVIVLSADTQDHHMRDAIAAGAIAYLTKPLAFEDLFATLDRLDATVTTSKVLGS